MASRVKTAAVVAGLVAFGATDGSEALAQAPQTQPPTSTTPPSTPPPRPARKVAHAKPALRNGLIATLPGFELLPDGGSRFFVELTKTATVAEKREGRTITYLISGARVNLRNNENALVTVHFNTPVTRARLFPVRGNVAFAIELRADTTATWRMVDNADGTASILQVDFPKGAYLPAGEYDPATDPSSGPEGISMRPPGADLPPGTAPAPAPAPPSAAAPPGPANP